MSTTAPSVDELARLAGISVPRGLTYHPESPSSFFVDAYMARHRQDSAAQQRLDSHAAEMRVELPRLQQRMRSASQPQGASFIESRAPSATFAAAPVWLVEMTATLPRPERSLAGLVPKFPLPDGVGMVGVPRLTSGTSVAVNPPGTPFDDSNSYTDAAATSTVPMIAGNADVPIQMIEQSGRLGASYDAVLYSDLLSAFDAQLEVQMMIGPGGTSIGSPLLGVTEVQGVNEVTYTSGSPLAIGAYPLLGQLLGSIGDNRKARPTAILMRFGRWIWWTTSEDDSGRPLGVPDAHAAAPDTPDNQPDAIGALCGVPVFSDEAIPTDFGGTTPVNGTEDITVACRPSDMPLWIGAPKLSLFEDVLSGDLEARIQLRRSVAFIPHRYPSSIGVLSGPGFAQQVNE